MSAYISVGLMELEPISPQLEVTDETKYGDPDDYKYTISKVELKGVITDIGHIIRKFLK